MKLRFLFGRKARDLGENQSKSKIFDDISAEMKPSDAIKYEKTQKIIDFHDFDSFDVSFAIFCRALFSEISRNLKIMKNMKMNKFIKNDEIYDFP